MKTIVFYQNWDNPDGTQQRKVGKLWPNGQFTGEASLEKDVKRTAELNGLDLTKQEDRTKVLMLYSGSYLIAVEE